MNNTIYKICLHAKLEIFDDGAVILNTKNFKLIELNSTARDILQATNGLNAIHEVIEQIVQLYEINAQDAEKDVQELYQHLLEQGIMETVTNDQS